MAHVLSQSLLVRKIPKIGPEAYGYIFFKDPFRGAYFWRGLRPWQTTTHCCGHIVADTNVSRLPARALEHLLRTQNLCPGHKNVFDFVQKHFVSAANVSQFAQPK